MFNHLKTNELISDMQHGFIPHRSCKSQLLSVLNKWTSILESGDSVDVIYLDFSKAFDSIPHLRLLNKLHSYGFRGRLLQWLKAYLSDRRQCVVVGDGVSGWSDVTSGVPQGSILGPLLFVIYVNELPDIVRNLLYLFADDTKLFAKIADWNDYASLQEDLDNLFGWSQSWQLLFKLPKCMVMHMGTHNPQFSYTIDGQFLDEVTEHKDLGVVFDNVLKFHSHVSTMASKANRILGMIKKCFTALNQTTLLLLYKHLVRPHLEYCNTVWNFGYLTDMAKIEKVQRRATRMLHNIRNLSYEERLLHLNLPSLSYRQFRGDMLTTFQILNGYVDLDATEFFDLSTITHTRGHPYKLYIRHTRSDIRKRYFCNRIIKKWNSLPSHVVEATSINDFKIKFDNYFRDVAHCVDLDL